MKFLAVYLVIGLLFSFGLAYGAKPNYETVSRCFFIYAPIFETGRDLQIQPFVLYSQKRIAWATGYIQAQQNNIAFKKVFEDNLTSNKKNGTTLEETLKNAIRSGNTNAYFQVMNVARNCDLQLGLPSNEIPPANSLGMINKASSDDKVNEGRKEESIDSLLIQVSSDINQQLPRMLDKETRLDTTFAGPGEKLTYIYTFVNLKAADVNSTELFNKMAPTIRNRACSNKDTAGLFKIGVTVVNYYQDKDGVFIMDIPVKPQDCGYTPQSP